MSRTISVERSVERTAQSAAHAVTRVQRVNISKNQRQHIVFVWKDYFYCPRGCAYVAIQVSLHGS